MVKRPLGSACSNRLFSRENSQDIFLPAPIVHWKSTRLLDSTRKRPSNAISPSETRRRRRNGHWKPLRAQSRSTSTVWRASMQETATQQETRTCTLWPSALRQPFHRAPTLYTWETDRFWQFAAICTEKKPKNSRKKSLNSLTQSTLSAPHTKALHPSAYSMPSAP